MFDMRFRSGVTIVHRGCLALFTGDPLEFRPWEFVASPLVPKRRQSSDHDGTLVQSNPRSFLSLYHRQFEQRYYEFFDHFRAPDGPIFLKICGEGPCTGIADDYLMVLAKKFGAAIVSLEHRYYGKSSPFKSFRQKT